MSLYAAASPRLGMSGSYSSSHCLTQTESLKVMHRKHYQSSSANEETPLVQEQQHSRDLPTNASSSSSSSSPEPSSQLSATLWTTITVVTIGSSLQFGYGTGVMNNAKDIILDDFHKRGLEYTLIEWSTTVSCFGIGGLLGALLGPSVIGRCVGRRTTLLINNVFVLIGSALIALAKAWWHQALGRIFIGMVAGIATAVVPTYFSEISPLAIRGAVGTMHQLGITVGILLSQALSTPSLHLLGSQEHWQWLFAVPVLCSLLELVVLPFCPESPSYLYKTKGKQAARDALVQFQSESVADEYLGYIAEEVSADSKASSSNMGIRELLCNRQLRKQLIVGVTVQLMMQFSGIDAVFYYSTTVFQQANVSDPELATTCLGLINVLVTIVAVKFMDSAGRKTLLTYSWIGMCASFCLLTASFIGQPYLSWMDQLSVVATTGVIVFFAFGPGCIAWFIIAEIFPLYARDSAMTIGIFINWVANWLVAFVFPILLVHTQPYTFLIFMATTGFFLWFTRALVPETKGQTATQLKDSFDSLPLWVC